MNKKIGLIVIFTFFFLVSSVMAEPEYTLVESYAEVNVDAYYGLYRNHPTADAAYSAVGQSFTMVDSNHKIGSAQFYIYKTGTPTGNVNAVLYAHSGVYGTSSEPTGAALATSDTINVLNLPTSGQMVTFNFTGAQRYEMQADTSYCIVVQNSAGGYSDGNGVLFGADNSSPSASGNNMRYLSSAWATGDTIDAIFSVYYVENIPDVLSVVSDATFVKDDSGWVNVTVRDLDGYANLDTVDIQVNTTNDAETFTLRWTQGTGVFSEVSDSSGICTIDPSVRANINTTTDLISFNFTFTGGADGLCDVKVTSVDDGGLTSVDVYSDEFTYATVVWSPLYWFVNSAAELFGLSGLMTYVVTYVTGIFVYLTSSFTNMLLLIVQIFTVINGVFTFVINWFTRTVSLLVSVFTIVTALLNGSHDILTDAINVWTTMNFAEWGVQFIPILVLIWWMESLDERGKVQGHNTVLFGDISTVINILSFFSTWFGLIINTGLDMAFRFVDLIQNI